MLDEDDLARVLERRADSEACRVITISRFVMSA